jgi:iron complex transport system substrate-binding protein
VAPRVVSLLASGTELLSAVGAGEMLVGRSHECDSPGWVSRLPCLSRPTFPVSGTSAEIDAEVRAKLAAGAPLYQVDGAALAALAPDLVITQSHCAVCAVSDGDVERDLSGAAPLDRHRDSAHVRPGLEGQRLLSLAAGDLEGILRDLRRLATAVGRAPEGAALERTLRAGMADWRRATADLPRPRVLCLEWTDPPFPMSNWGPELVELAGGACLLGTPGAHSASSSWQRVLDADPDVLVVAPCGFRLARAAAEIPALQARPGWRDLRAVRAGRAYVADGNRFFNRSGPGAFETIAPLAEMIHPDLFPPTSESTIYVRL